MPGILVTGPSGALGGEILRQLRETGHKVVALAEPGEITTQNASAAEEIPPRVVALGADHCDSGALIGALKGIHTIYHCAGFWSDWGRKGDFQARNVRATGRLLQAARAAGVRRFIFASSSAIYAEARDRLALTEADSLAQQFMGNFARSKFEADRMVRMADRPQLLRTVRIRPCGIYGRADGALIAWMRQAMRQGTLPVIDGGEALIDITHASDAARAMILAGEQAHLVGGRAFNITSGQSVRFKTLMALIAEQEKITLPQIELGFDAAMQRARRDEILHWVLGREGLPELTRALVLAVGRSLTFDISAARSALGYEPRITLESMAAFEAPDRAAGKGADAAA